MLARALPGVAVVVGADRYLSGRLAEQRLGATVHVLDDGFQHLELERDVDLLLVAEDDLHDRPMPAGRLREGLAAAAAADAALVTAGYDTAAERIGRALHIDTVFRVTRAIGAPRMIGGDRDSVVVPHASRVFLVTGIARPERFVDDIAGAGWDIAGMMEFRDHHRFDPRDVAPDRRGSTARRRCDRADDGKGRRAAGGVRSRRPADRLRSAGRRHRASGPLPRLAAGAPGLRSHSASRTLHLARRTAHLRPRTRHPAPVAMRHRLEYLIVRALIAIVGVMPDAIVRAFGTMLGLAFYTVDRAHRRIAERNLATAFPARPEAERRAIARAAFAHFGRLLFELLQVQHVVARADAGAGRVRRRGARAARLRAGQGRAVHHRPFRVLGAARDGARAPDRADRVAGARARQPAAQSAARADAAGHRATP